MRYLGICLAVSASLLTFSPAFSQECTDLARVIARESERFADRNQVDILNKANLCSAEYEMATNEQRAQIEASYGLFSGGASGSTQSIREMQKSRCESKYGREWRDRVTSTDIQRVSQTGADVVRACLNSRSFRLVDLKIQDEALTAAFRFGGSGEVTINGIVVTPSDIAECSVLHAGDTQTDLSKIVGVKVRAGDTVTLNCRRLADAVDKTRKNFRGGLIGIATTAELAQVPLISYTEPPLSESTAESLNKQINSLKTDLEELKLSSKAYSDKLQSELVVKLSTGGATTVTPGGNAPMAHCPPGQYLVAVNRQTDSGGPHGITSWLFPVCRAIQ